MEIDGNSQKYWDGDIWRQLEVLRRQVQAESEKQGTSCEPNLIPSFVWPTHGLYKHCAILLLTPAHGKCSIIVRFFFSWPWERKLTCQWSPREIMCGKAWQWDELGIVSDDPSSGDTLPNSGDSWPWTSEDRCWMKGSSFVSSYIKKEGSKGIGILAIIINTREKKKSHLINQV